jgi:thiol-disulfide isomerase/thioredoxin
MVVCRRSTTPNRKASAGVLSLCTLGAIQFGATAALGEEVEVVSAEQVQALIAENEGSVVVVNFWATWCPPCLKEFPDLIDVHEQKRSRGVAVLAVSMNAADETQDVDEFLHKFAPSFPVYRAASVDEAFFNGIVQPWYGELPITLVYDAAGALRHYHRKAIMRDELSAELDALLAER